MPSIADVPAELFLDNIFPYLPTPDILSLGCTNRFFSDLASDEPFWHQRIQEDFNFLGSETARQTGWKFLYKRLSSPKVYVWGAGRSQGRLGRQEVPKTNVRDGVPSPIRLNIPHVRIVSLVAGGMSFHAIDSRGDIYVWGVLDGTAIMAWPSNGFADASQKALQPMRLKLPVKFRTLSCGRLHTTGLDANGQVWTFTSWGRPFRLNSSLLDKSSPETSSVQVESGWCFSSVLTESGDVLIYWPDIGRMQRIVDQKSEELEKSKNKKIKIASKARPTESEPNVIPCYWWVMHGADPARLPPIPANDLPEIRGTGLSREELDKETKLVKIAGFDNNLLGLTNKGHVLRYSNLTGEDECQEGRWQYLPYFSDIAQIKTLPAYTANENSTPLTPPETMHITHISASFHTFFAYSTGASSAVLMGQHITEQVSPLNPLINEFRPTIIPELQNKSVISVVLGDYHYGALTADGKLLTWGAFSKGALGLGDPVEIPVGQPGGYTDENERHTSVNGNWGIMRPPPDVRTPTEVRFDHREKRKRPKFCFAAAALGWHTGALVIDLDPDQEGDDVEITDGTERTSFPVDDNRFLTADFDLEWSPLSSVEGEPRPPV